MQLNYNLLLGRNYMYAMRAVASTMFCLMMFPHDGNIVTMDQLTYHHPHGPTTTEIVIPTVHISINNITIPSMMVFGPILFVDTSMMASFPSLPPSLASSETKYLCVISSNNSPPKPQPHPQTQAHSQPQMKSPRNYWGSLLVHAIPFISPPSNIVSKPVMTTLNLPNFTLGIPV